MIMHQRLTIIIATGAALGAAALIAAPGGAQQSPTALVLINRHSEDQTKIVDNPPRKKDGAGDIIVIDEKLRDTRGAVVGQAYAVFVQTRRAAQGTITFRVPGGRIEAAGIDGVGDSGEFAIVGGTGDYAGARGTVTRSEIRGGQQFKFAFLDPQS